ncbi:MAG: WD40 repeat domain-containing protein, partial [Nitrospinae bacterium]|nr:WD40 repeat domain-containing protein [Nitrospinota bacterium]
MRTWEVESGSHLSTVKGHSFPVLSLAYSSDGKFMATGGMDRKLKLWKAESGKEILTFSKKLISKDFYQIAFSPDSQTLASADGNKIKLWEVSTGNLLQTFEGHTSDVASLAFSPNSKLLASGGIDKNIKIWNVSTAKEINNLIGHSKRVGAVVFSPNSNFLASGSGDKTAKIWEVATGKLIHTLKGHTGAVSSLAFSPNGKTLVTGSWDTTVRTWDLSSGESILTISDHSNMVNVVKFYPKGSIFASGSSDGTIKLRENSTGSLVRTIKLRRSHIAAKSRPKKDKYAWRKTFERPFENIAFGKLISFAFNNFTKYVDLYENSIAFSPDGKAFASIRKDGTVKIWDPKTGKSLLDILFQANSLAFSPDGRILAIAGNPIKQSGYWIALIGIKENFSSANKGSSLTLSSIKRLNGHTKPIKTVAFNPDGKTLATGSSDKTIIIWDAKSGSPLKVLKGHTGKIKSLAYSPNGLILASAGNDETIKLWETKTGKLIRDLKGHSKTINTVAFHPNGKILASGSNDSTVKTWVVDNGQVLHDLKLRSNLVNSIAFHPNGKTLISGHWNETVNIIDFATGKVLNTLKGHTSSINSIAFSPDGKTLISGGRNKIVKVWEAKTGKLLNTIKGNTINKDADLLVKASDALAKNKSRASINKGIGKAPSKQLPLNVSSAKPVEGLEHKTPEILKIANSANPAPTNRIETKFKKVEGWLNKILPIHGSFFMTKIPSHWSQKPAVNQSNKELHIMGYFPKNTKLETWTEMITILGQNSKGRSPKQFFGRLYQVAQKSCTKQNTGVEIIKEDPELFLALIYCGRSTIETDNVANLKKGQGEITAYRIYKKGDNLFYIAHAWRGKGYDIKEKDEKLYPATNKERIEFFASTNSTMICEKDSQQASCKESIKFFLTDLLAQNSKASQGLKQKNNTGAWSNLMLPVYDSFVMTQIPSNWAQKPAFNRNDGKYHLIEFLPQGQTLKEWSEMISVSGLTKKGYTKKDYFNFMYLQTQKYCGKINTAAEVVKETTEVFIATLYCGKTKEGTEGISGLKKGQGEITVYRIYKKGDNFFSVFHSWRGKEFDVKSKNAKDYPGSIKARANYLIATNPTVICDKDNPTGICQGYVSNYLKEAAGKTISAPSINRLKLKNTKIKPAYKLTLNNQENPGWANIMLLLYNDFVITQIPENWPLLPEADSDRSLLRVIKFVPKNQTVKNWEEMIIVQA